MRHVPSIIGLFVLTCVSPLLAEEIVGIKDAKLVDLLNNFEILAEVKTPPYSIRVLRLREHGECDKLSLACPSSTIFIAASTFDEDPDQNVYQLPKAHSWELIRLKGMAAKEGKESYAVFEMKRSHGKATLSVERPSDVLYEVRVNPWKAHLIISQSNSR